MTARFPRLTRATVALGAMVALVAGGTAAAITTATAAAGDGAIAGTVSDPGGYPVAGATIKVYAADGNQAGTAATDSSGRFRLNDVATDGDDTYRYQAIDPSGRHVARYSASFAVKANVTTTINLSLKAAGVIQGKVYTQNGSAPLSAARTVQVSATVGVDGGPNGYVMVSPTGGFRLGGLPTGSYSVSFDDTARVYDGTCYNNVRRTQKGCVGVTKVTVTAGKTTTLSRQVLKNRLGLLSGKVTDSAGQPLQGMKVDTFTSATDGSIPVTTAADGTWKRTLDHIGKVRIRVSDPSGVHRTTWYVSATSYATATPVTMTDGAQITSVHVTMPKS